MPPLPSLPRLIKYTWYLAGPEGAAAQTTHHLLASADLTAPMLADLATNLATHTISSMHLHDWFIQRMTNSWSLGEVTTQALDGNEYQGSAGITNTGTHGDAGIPPSLGWVWSYGINAYYRGGHPRTCFPGVSQTYLQSVGGRLLTSAAIANFANDGASYLDWITALPAVDGATFTPVCVSYYRNRALRPTPVTYSLNSVVVRERLGSVRRRLGKQPPL